MKRTFHIFQIRELGIYLGMAALVTTGCSSEKPEARELSGPQVSASSIPKPAATPLLNSQPDSNSTAAINSMNNNISSSQEQINQAADKAAEKEKERAAEANENAAKRQHQMAMTDKELAVKSERNFMDALVGLTYMRTMADIAHPDGCVGQGIIAGLKDTADSLRCALSTTDEAVKKQAAKAPKEPGAAAVKTEIPAAALPPQPEPLTYQLRKGLDQIYTRDFVGPIPGDAWEVIPATAGKPAAQADSSKT